MQHLSAVQDQSNQSLKRRIDALLLQMQTLLDSLAEYDDTPAGRARRAEARAESYAGSVRLAPADPLPWPFTLPSPQVPSPFRALRLTPVEWWSDDGTRVYGWRVHE